MNKDQMEGNWKQFKGKVQQMWGKLTDDDINRINGNREQLVGRIQECYGVAREDAERQVRDFEGQNRYDWSETTGVGAGSRTGQTGGPGSSGGSSSGGSFGSGQGSTGQGGSGQGNRR